MARAILDGYRTGDLRPDALLFQDVLGIAAALAPSVAAEGRADPRIVLSALGSMALGWRIFGDFPSTGFGLDTMPLEQRDAAIDGFITAVMLARPVDRDPGAGGT